jgi:predicted RNA-binding Zn ribbon-like protein
MLVDMASMVAPAPGRLEVVRQFVNTLDIESGEDQIPDPAGLLQWLAAHRLDPTAALTARDVDRTIALREALRESLAANHDRAEVPTAVREVLNATASRARLTVEFGADRGWRTTPQGRGIDGAFGTLLAIVVDAMTDGTWARLKVCSNDECRWAFYDNSRARTAKWCSMRICGNRLKQQAWRDRHTSQP